MKGNKPATISAILKCRHSAAERDLWEQVSLRTEGGTERKHTSTPKTKVVKA